MGPRPHVNDTSLRIYPDRSATECTKTAVTATATARRDTLQQFRSPRKLRLPCSALECETTGEPRNALHHPTHPCLCMLRKLLYTVPPASSLTNFYVIILCKSWQAFLFRVAYCVLITFWVFCRPGISIRGFACKYGWCVPRFTRLRSSMPPADLRSDCEAMCAAHQDVRQRVC